MQLPPARAPPGRIFQTFGRTTRRVEYPYHPPLGRGFRAPAFILSLAALYDGGGRARPSLRAPSALRGASGGATMTIPGGRAHLRDDIPTFPVLAAPASIIGSELPWLTGSGPLSWIETFVTFCGIVWLRAKVLGQMGWTTSPYLRAGALSCPS